VTRLLAWLAALVLVLTPAPNAARANEAEIALPVPRGTIYPGDAIDAEALSERLFVARTVARGTVFEGREALLGKVARRTLLPGQPIPVNAIREPFAVSQGKPAQLVFKAEGLTITSAAIALQNGSIGDVVTARNVDSGTIVRGTVQADGTLRVGGQ
jgi:flagella basal body P-ring formation protein FlgA